MDYDIVANHGRPKGVTMCQRLSIYAPIFLLLALSGIIFFLWNIYMLENRSNTALTFIQLQDSIRSAFAEDGPPLSYHNYTFCSHLGVEPSSDQALEERYLLNSIAWPQPPAPLPLHRTSDPVHSRFTILPFSDRKERHLGEDLEVLVQIYDYQGRPKRYGGDFLLARLHSPELGAGVAGRVVDHHDGFYSAQFPLLWEGSALVEITLVHSSEAVAVLQRLREERPDRVYFQSLFSSGHLSETTQCHMCLTTNQQQPLCNFTDLRTGEPWYCIKPKLLSCDTRINHATGGYQPHIITSKEALLFQSGVNIKEIIHASGPDGVTVLPKKTDEPEVENNSIKPDPTTFIPSGYYYKGSWRPLGGKTVHQQFNSSTITQCLTGKVINIYGDSTVRQWFEYLNASIPEIKEFNLHSPKKVGPYMAVDSKHNILLKYRCHGPPIRYSTVSASELRYIANELDGLPGGPDTVVVLSIWSHFTIFPVEFYIHRLHHIRSALVRLLNRGPGTLVVIRSAGLQALDKEVYLYGSDWFSLQLDKVLRAMFKGLDIVFVDAWEISPSPPSSPPSRPPPTTSHHQEHDRHNPVPCLSREEKLEANWRAGESSGRLSR